MYPTSKGKPLCNQKAANANRNTELADHRPDYPRLERNQRIHYNRNREQKDVASEERHNEKRTKLDCRTNHCDESLPALNHLDYQSDEKRTPIRDRDRLGNDPQLVPGFLSCSS